MLFNSWTFLIFFPIVFILYWFVVNKSVKIQNTFLAITGFVFYGWWDWRFLLLLILSLVTDFAVGYFLQTTINTAKRKLLIIFSLAFNIGLLVVFKYYNFFAQSLQNIFSVFGLKVDFVTVNIILPVGISFYTFQSLSYTIQVYRNKMEATKDFIAYAAYISFFPQLIAGPIEKATQFLPKFFKKRTFNYTQATNGVKLILWGYFKKVVIADTCAGFVNDIFNNYTHYKGFILIIGAVYFAFQIYCDFSGYTDIARGLAKLLGFELMLNFNYPYFAKNIREFWHRWHISLSTWFRDYLFVPLGGSKKTINKTAINILIVFLVSGLWHGANATFICWGLLHALYYLPSVYIKRKEQTYSRLINILNIFITFALVTFAWIFFRANTITDAFHYINRMFHWNGIQFPGKTSAFFLILFLLMIDWVGRNNENALTGFVNKFPSVRYAMYLILAVFILANFYQQQSFIYFQF